MALARRIESPDLVGPERAIANTSLGLGPTAGAETGALGDGERRTVTGI
jgi:hypothetical protein